MVSFEHQGLCKLLGERPRLVRVLLRTLLGVPLPRRCVLVPAPETIRALRSPEHAVDVVVANRRATGRRPHEAFVFEVQLRPDRDKWWSWPIHVCGVRARHRCPTTLVVITTNERTARWAAKPIEFGRARGVLRPLVIGPRQIPRVLDRRQARACPELATLAVIVHGHLPGSKRLIRTALEVVIERLAKERDEDSLLLELVLGSVPSNTLREIEDEMELDTPLISRWSKVRIAQGKREALLLVLRGRGLSLTAAQVRRIEGCTNARQLDAWLRRAAVVDRVAQLFSGKASS